MSTLALLPSPSWSGFTLGPFTVHAYALCLLLGLVVGMWLTTRRWVAKGGHDEDVWTMAMIAVPAGIIGARLFYVLSVPGPYFGSGGSPVAVFRIWDGGLNVWGALIFGVLAIWLVARVTGVRALAFLDAAAPGILIGQAIGRLGDWFTQENFGAQTTLPWGLRIDPVVDGAPNLQWPGAQVPEGTLFHPTFLYESLWTLAGGLLLVFVVPRLRLADGRTFLLAIAFYAVGRAWIELLRLDPSVVLLGLRINVWVSLVVLAAAVVGFILLGRRGAEARTRPYSEERTADHARAREDERLRAMGGESDFSSAPRVTPRGAVPQRPSAPPTVSRPAPPAEASRSRGEASVGANPAPAAPTSVGRAPSAPAPTAPVPPAPSSSAAGPSDPAPAPTAPAPSAAAPSAPVPSAGGVSATPGESRTPAPSAGASAGQFRSRREAKEARGESSADTGKVFGFWGAVTSAIRIVPQSKPATRQLPAQKQRADGNRDPRNPPPGDFR